MKNKIVVLKLTLVAALFGWNVVSQAHHVGVEGGVGIFDTTLPASPSTTNFVGGLFGEWMIIDNLSFRPELLTQPSGPNYLSVPLMVAYHYDAGAFQPFVFLGPEVAGLISGSNTNTAINLAIDGGVGLEYWLDSQISVAVNWRYSLGLTNGNTSASPISYQNRNMYILAAVGYKF